MKTVAVIQSNYLPWKGYFDIIHDVDLFIFYDDVQYTKNDWRNRNKIKTLKGAEWIAIPVGKREDRLICDVEINDRSWSEKHWQKLNQCYLKAPFFKCYEGFFKEFYLKDEYQNLSELNQFLIKAISKEFLGIQTTFADSRTFKPAGKKLDRLIDLLLKAGATKYISGPSARGYIDELQFLEVGIELVYKDYSGYPEYPQFFPPFTHQVSILDLLFQTGSNAPNYIWGWR